MPKTSSLSVVSDITMFLFRMISYSVMRQSLPCLNGRPTPLLPREKLGVRSMETAVPGLVKIILGGANADKDENKSESGLRFMNINLPFA